MSDGSDFLFLRHVSGTDMEWPTASRASYFDGPEHTGQGAKYDREHIQWPHRTSRGDRPEGVTRGTHALMSAATGALAVCFTQPGPLADMPTLPIGVCVRG